MKNILSTFITGLMSIIPIILILLLITYTYDIFLYGYSYIFGKVNGNSVATIFLIIATFSFIYYMGSLIKNRKKTLIHSFSEYIFNKIPIIKEIYKVLVDIFDMFFNSENNEHYLGVISTTFEGGTIYALITKKEKIEVTPQLKEYLNKKNNIVITDEYINRLTIYYPTAPNPTNGFVFFLYENIDNYYYENITPSEAISTIISLGIKN